MSERRANILEQDTVRSLSVFLGTLLSAILMFFLLIGLLWSSGTSVFSSTLSSAFKYLGRTKCDCMSRREKLKTINDIIHVSTNNCNRNLRVMCHRQIKQQTHLIFTITTILMSLNDLTVHVQQTKT